MMKLSLAVVLVILAVDYAATTEVCEVRRGKKLISFSKTRESVRFPCKYNALKRTVCGRYRITLTPGNMLDPYRKKMFVIKTLWLAVENIATGRKWQGRTELKIARKYLEGIEEAPFRRKRGSLNTSELFDYGDENADNEVSMTDKNKEFKVTFGLYDPYGDWHKSSGFKFECFSSTFEPTDYPTQLCGNGTKREVQTYKKSMGWRDNRMATLFLNVFSNQYIVQAEWDCQSAATAIQSACKTREAQYNAAKLCWPILGKRKYQRCFTKHADGPTEVFRNCIHFTCTQDINSCSALGPSLDMCPELNGVTEAVRAKCFPNLSSN